MHCQIQDCILMDGWQLQFGQLFTANDSKDSQPKTHFIALCLKFVPENRPFYCCQSHLSKSWDSLHLHLSVQNEGEMWLSHPDGQKTENWLDALNKDFSRLPGRQISVSATRQVATCLFFISGLQSEWRMCHSINPSAGSESVSPDDRLQSFCDSRDEERARTRTDWIRKS